MKKAEGLAITQRFSDALHKSGYPVQRVILFGSVARNEGTEDSDLDIAVVCTPFGTSRHEENMLFRRIRRTVDVRIEPFTLHADDFAKPYFSLPQEIEREGVEV